MRSLFVVSEGWKAAYPGAAAGILAMRGVANPPQHPVLRAQTQEVERQLRARFAGATRRDLAASPTIQAYDAYYRRYKKTYHVGLQLESVALKGKPIPAAGSLVEAMFAAELKNLLLTAGHDLATLDRPVRLDVAAGTEQYTLLGGQPETLKAGDMYMADGQGVISSVLYGPDRRTRITPSTQQVLYAVYAPAGIGAAAVEEHLRDIEASVRLFSPQAETEALEVFAAE